MNDDARQHYARPARRRPHRAVDAVRDLDRVRGGDAGGLGPAAARNAGCRCRTPGMPKSIGHHAHFFDARGGTRVKGCSSSHDMLGMTSVPFGPRGSWSAAISPAGPPSTGLTFEKAHGPAARRPAARPGRGVGRSVGLGDRLGGHEGIISQPHQSRNSGGRKTQGFQKSKALSRNREEPSPCPFQRENRAPEGSIFSLGFPQRLCRCAGTRTAEETLWKSWRKTPTAAPSLWNERELYGFQPRRLPWMCGRR